MTVDRNILPGMKPTRHSFRCGQPLGPGVAHHGMRNLVHHAQAHVASPRGERLPAQVADHLSDAAYVVIPVASVPGRSALDHVKLVDIFLGMWVPYRRSSFISIDNTVKIATSAFLYVGSFAPCLFENASHKPSSVATSSFASFVRVFNVANFHVFILR